MAPDPSFFHKLWDKGVDIFATIISTTLSAGIVAVIATFTWRWKRKRDLALDEAKIRQRARIEDELAARKQEIERRVPIQRLVEEREQFAARAEKCQLSDVAQIEGEILHWLFQKGLQSHAGNDTLMGNWYRPGTLDSNSPRLFAADIRRIRIPGEETLATQI